jgi:hypothetical protein
VLQAAMLHAPLVQPGAAFGRLHTFLHAPQLSASTAVWVSHPFDPFPSQSDQPATHDDTVHVLLAQAAFAFAMLHANPQLPQFFASVASVTSQPFAALLSQSAKPVLQEVMVQALFAQPALAFVSKHVFPHAPQFIAFVARLVSQPFAAMPSQSP